MSTRDIINAIESGDSVTIQSEFENAMASRIADRLDTMRQDVARGMFKSVVAAEPVEVSAESGESAE